MQRNDREFVACVHESRAERPTERAVKRDYTVASMWAAARLAHPECAYTHATIETIDGAGRILARDTMWLTVKRDDMR